MFEVTMKNDKLCLKHQNIFPEMIYTVKLLTLIQEGLFYNISKKVPLISKIVTVIEVTISDKF